MQGAEKNSYKEFDTEKNSCGSKIPLPPPITFLMVGPLVKKKYSLPLSHINYYFFSKLSLTKR